MPSRRAIAVLALLIALSTNMGSANPAWAADGWFTSSDGVRLHYIERGPAGGTLDDATRGHTIVLVPGWTMPAWIWDAQIADFSRHYHVVAFDPRSQGDSQVARDGHEPGRRGQDIAELIAHVASEPVLLVGWSLGVLDALAYLHSDGDERIAGLVLVDNSVGEDPPPSPMRISRRVARRMPRASTMYEFVRGMFRRHQSADYLNRLTATCLRTPESAALALLSYPMPRAYWKEAVYSTIRPVLYVVTPRLTGQAENLRAHHPAAESVVLQGVGHALFVDDPVRFDALVADFIGRRVWP
jgi:non-heme chloroperoxidase